MKSADFPITTTSVTALTKVKITGKLTTSSKSANVQVIPLLKSVAVKPSSVVGGKTAIGTVTLNGPAGPGGATVNLASGNPAATVPASVMVPEGHTTATFTVDTSPVSGNTAGTIGASVGGVTVGATFTVTAPTVTGFAISPNPVKKGAQATGKLTLSGKAPAGFTVTLTSSNGTALPVPATITFAAGATTASFSTAAGNVGAQVVVTLTATTPAGATKTSSATVNP
jgi:hypothetical protein